MKKFISKILIASFLFNIIGYPLTFNVLQRGVKSQIKRSIRRGIRDEELKIIASEDVNIHWIIPGREFRYYGEMYDVVKSKVINQKKFFYCIWDKKEKELIANYTKTNNLKTDKIIKNFKTIQLYLNEISKIIYPTLYSKLYYQYLNKLIDNEIKIPSPPPKFA